jgi:nitrous oxide reductase
MSEEINHDRRRFLGTAAMTFAAAQLGMIGSAKAQSSKTGELAARFGVEPNP